MQPLVNFVRSRRDHLVLGLLACVGAFLLLQMTATTSLFDGALEMTPDSVQYVAAAHSLRAGHDLMRYEGIPYVAWPPLYPLVIAALYSVSRFITTDLIHALRYFHVLLFMIFIVTSGFLFLRYIQSRAIAYLGTVAVLVSPALYTAHGVWSEPLFLVLTMLFLLVMGNLLEQPSPRRLLLGAVLAALIVLQRYSGVAVVCAGGILIVFFLHRLTFWRRLVYAFSFGVIAMTPTALWLWRNTLLVGQAAGNRSPSQRSLTENLGATFALFVDWFMLVAVVLGVIFLVVAFIRHRAALPLPPLVLLVIYTAFLIVTLSVYNQGAISLHYLMPVYVPALIVLCALADRVLPRRWALPLVALWLIAYVMPASLAEINRLAPSCCSTAWRNSELIDWLEVHAGELTQPLYANTPLSQYRGIPVRDLPRQFDQLTTPQPASDYTPPDAAGVYVVWYYFHYHDPCTRCYMQDYRLGDYQNLFSLTPIVELTDGAVFHVTAK